MKRLLLVTFAISALCLVPHALSQRIITEIPVGGQPANPVGLVVNLTTNKIYVLNTTLNAITVVDASSNQVITNVPLGSTPVAAAVNPTTNMVYVTASNYPNNSIVVIDGSSNTVSETIPITLAGWIAVNPVTNLIYFTNGFSGGGENVAVLNGATNQIVATIATAVGIEAMAVNPVTNRIYLAIPYSSQQLGVIDGATNKLAAFQIPGLCFTLSIAVDSVLNRIYVQDDLCSVLYVIGGAANNVVATILPGSPGPMGLNPTSHR
jgi:YVTN family beta-propeller protein